MQPLLERVREYLPDDKADLVARALEYADRMHEGQLRRSGGPYIEHPVAVASYLAGLSLDATTLAAALLHDVVEDCGISLDEIRREFGDGVATLVDGVTKLQRLDLLADGADARLAADHHQAESLRKMLVSMAEDIRVVLIKLADRLHNMETLHALAADRRVAIAQETLDIYAPLAHRLGMGEIKWQLEDFAFRYIQPNQYRAISKLLAARRGEREDYVRQLTDILKRELVGANLDAEVTGRPKHIYSVHRKAQAYRAQGKEFGDIYDLFAVRILVPTVADCYAALGVVHALWRPVPGEFDDYIANPKENLYQSLHTSVRAVGGVPIEVQVRTHKMHQLAEYGVASHWRYKEGSSTDGRFEERMTWLRQLLEWQQDLPGTEDFLESVRTDIFKDQVFVYTPKNEIKELPAGSTPIDFAYRIHTELGHRCIGAKVNGKLVSLDTPLHSGDTIEILTSKAARGPSLDWLNTHLGFVHTATARQAIRSWYRKQRRGENAERGRELLKKELRRLNVPAGEDEVAKLFGLDSVEELHVSIGSGVVSIAQIAARLSASQEDKRAAAATLPSSPEQPSAGVSVLGLGGLLSRMGACCNPLPGDEIAGFITRNRGVTVHRQDCPNLRAGVDDDRLIPVSWGASPASHPTRIEVTALDRVGLLHDITGTVAGEGVNISGSQTTVGDDGTVTIAFSLHVSSIEQLSRIFSRIEAMKSVTVVQRVAHRPPPRTNAKRNVR